jgi:hypothetical protein
VLYVEKTSMRDHLAIAVIASAAKQSPASLLMGWPLGWRGKNETGDCFVAAAPRNDS